MPAAYAEPGSNYGPPAPQLVRLALAKAAGALAAAGAKHLEVVTFTSSTTYVSTYTGVALCLGMGSPGGGGGGHAGITEEGNLQEGGGGGGGAPPLGETWVNLVTGLSYTIVVGAAALGGAGGVVGGAAAVDGHAGNPSTVTDPSPALVAEFVGGSGGHAGLDDSATVGAPGGSNYAPDNATNVFNGNAVDAPSQIGGSGYGGAGGLPGGGPSGSATAGQAGFRTASNQGGLAGAAGAGGLGDGTDSGGTGGGGGGGGPVGTLTAGAGGAGGAHGAVGVAGGNAPAGSFGGGGGGGGGGGSASAAGNGGHGGSSDKGFIAFIFIHQP